MADPMYFVDSMTARDRSGSGRRALTLEQLARAVGPRASVCERLTAPRKVKPYFDSESYHDVVPSPERVGHLGKAFTAGIDRIFADQPSGVPPIVVTATRHGKDPRHPGKHKVSFRGWVTNYSADYTVLKDAIIAHGLSEEFDTGVYKEGEQLLGCVGCCKSHDDPRVLTPTDPTEPLSSFVVQHLVGNEEPFRLVVRPDAPAAGVPDTEGERRASVAVHPVNTLTSVRDRDKIVKCLHLLSKSRWDDRATWVKLAIILKGECGDELFDEWVRLSQTSAKFDAQNARETWASVGGKDDGRKKVTVGTLYKWAQEDDPAGYRAVRAASVPPYVLERYDHGHRGLAEIARFLMADRFKRCGRAKNAVFYLFDERTNRWTEGSKDIVTNPMSRELEEALWDICGYFKHKSGLVASESDELKRYEEQRDRAAKAVQLVRSCHGINSVVTMAAPLFHDDTFEQRLDSVPHLLGVANGVVDLRTGALRARAPEDMIFTVLETEYDPAADTSEFERLVLEIMADDADKARFLQKLLGYGITGETCEEIFAVFTGSGRNGKGLLTQTIADILGLRLFKVMNPAVICDRQVSNIDAEKGNLLGARIAVFKELKPKERLKTNEVQLLSGGDGIPATPKYKDPMVIQPRHLCILETNHMPEIDVVLPAILNRLVCVHFPVTFTDLLPGEEPSRFRRQGDNGLKDRLKTMHAAVLKWLVDGAVAWYAAKDLRRNAPASVKDFTNEYFAEQDRLIKFLRECCTVEAAATTKTAEFLDAYNRWAAACKAPRFDDKKMAAAMGEKGFAKKPLRGDGGRCQRFVGVAFDPERFRSMLEAAEREMEGVEEFH